MYVVKVYSYGKDIGYVARPSGRYILAVSRHTSKVEHFDTVFEAVLRIRDLPGRSFAYSILDDSEVYLDV